MKTNMKKIVASVIAVTSLTVGMTGLSTNATAAPYKAPTGYVSFGKGATAGINRNSTEIVLSTSCPSSHYVSVKLSSAGYTTISEKSGTTYDDTDGYISHRYTGTGIKSAKGYHKADSYSVTTSR